MPPTSSSPPPFLRDLVVPRLKEASQALDLDRTSPYFLSRDGKVLIIIAEPSRPISDMAFARKLVEAINQARKGASVKISCTGAHLSAVTDEAILKKNVIVAVHSSLAVVLAIFYGTYRRFLPTMLILVFAIVLAVGIGGLIFPDLSIISLAFTSYQVAFKMIGRRQGGGDEGMDKVGTKSTLFQSSKDEMDKSSNNNEVTRNSPASQEIENPLFPDAKRGG